VLREQLERARASPADPAATSGAAAMSAIIAGSKQRAMERRQEFVERLQAAGWNTEQVHGP
jgi:hypothetical protein